MKMPQAHLAILKKRYLDLILSGEKTVESRFMRRAIAPMGKICKGDVVFLKESAGAVVATARAGIVKEFRDLEPEKIAKIRLEYNRFICGETEFWVSVADKKYAMLVELCDVKAIEPVRIKKKDWRAWVVLSDNNNYGLVQSSKFKVLS